nr:mediator of RNA polymerase II transcription subunit 12-like isoform X2 [Pogona vitticeps]
MDESEPPLDPVVLESRKASEEALDTEEQKPNEENNEENISEGAQHQESGDTGDGAVEPDVKHVMDETLQTDSKVSVFKRKEFLDQNDQTDSPSGTVVNNTPSIRKQSRGIPAQEQQLHGQKSRHGSQHLPGQESRLSLPGQESWHSQQLVGQESHRSSQHSQHLPGHESRRGSQLSQHLPSHESRLSLSGKESRRGSQLMGQGSHHGSQQSQDLPGQESRRGSQLRQPPASQESRHSLPGQEQPHHGSLPREQLPGHESHRGSQQSTGHQLPQSRKPSRAQPVDEVATKPDMTWISQKTGKVMKCESQQTSRIWQKKPLAEILEPFSQPPPETGGSRVAEAPMLSASTEQPTAPPLSDPKPDSGASQCNSQQSEEEDSWISPKTGKLMKCTSQQTSKIWERKPLAEILRLSSQGPQTEQVAVEDVTPPGSETVPLKEREAGPTAEVDAQLGSQEGSASRRGSQKADGKESRRGSQPVGGEKPSGDGQVVDQRLQTDSQVSVFRRKELADQTEQTDFPPGSVIMSATSFQKLESRRGSQQGQESRRASQQEEGKQSGIPSEQPEEQEPEPDKQHLEEEELSGPEEQPKTEEASQHGSGELIGQGSQEAEMDQKLPAGEDQQAPDIVPEERNTWVDGRTGAKMRSTSLQTSESLFIDYLKKIYGSRYVEPPCPEGPGSGQSLQRDEEKGTEKEEPGPLAGDVTEDVQPVSEQESPKDSQQQDMPESLEGSQQPETAESRKSSQQVEVPGSRKGSQQIESTESQPEAPGSRKGSQQPEATESRKGSQQLEATESRKGSQQLEATESRKGSQQLEATESRKGSQQAEVPGSQKESQQPEATESRKGSQQLERTESRKGSQQAEISGSRKGSLPIRQDSQPPLEEAVEQPHVSESQATIGSILSSHEVEDKAQQTYSVISLEDGIWLNRKTGRFLVSHSQQTRDTSLLTFSQSARGEEGKAESPSGLGTNAGETAADMAESGPISAKSEPEVDGEPQQVASPACRRDSQGMSSQELPQDNQEAPCPEKPQEEDLQGTENVENVLSRRLSEATIQSIIAADGEDKSQRTYSAVSLEQGSFINRRTGRQLQSMGLQTDESSFQKLGEDPEIGQDDAPPAAEEEEGHVSDPAEGENSGE